MMISSLSCRRRVFCSATLNLPNGSLEVRSMARFRERAPSAAEQGRGHPRSVDCAELGAFLGRAKLGPCTGWSGFEKRLHRRAGLLAETPTVRRQPRSACQPAGLRTPENAANMRKPAMGSRSGAGFCNFPRTVPRFIGK